MYGVAEEGQWPTFPGLSDTEALLLKMARLTAEVGGVSIDCDGHFSLTCEALAEDVSAILENLEEEMKWVTSEMGCDRLTSIRNCKIVKNLIARGPAPRTPRLLLAPSRARLLLQLRRTSPALAQRLLILTAAAVAALPRAHAHLHARPRSRRRASHVATATTVVGARPVAR